MALAERLKRLIAGHDDRALLWTAVAIGAAAHLVALILFGKIGPKANIWEYGVQAQCALRTGGDLCQYYFSGPQGSYPSAYMPPFLSYMWLLLFKMFGDTAVARIVWLAINWAISLINIGLLFQLGRRWKLSPMACFLAAVTLALYPTFVFVVATYHQTEWTVMFLLLLALLGTQVLQSAESPLKAVVWMGVVSGFATLNRSEMIIIGPAMIVLVCALRRQILPVVAAAVAMILVLAPWTVRNYQVFHRVVPVAQSAGYNLWKGFNPYTNGSGNMTEMPGGPGDRKLSEIRDRTPHGPMFEPALQDAYKEQFKHDLAAAGPVRLAELVVTKTALLWGFDWTDREITARPLYRLPWLVANVLALYGLVLVVQRRGLAREGVIVGGALLLLLTAAYAATAVHTRYRMHIEPLLFLLTGVGIEALVLMVLRVQRDPSPQTA